MARAAEANPIIVEVFGFVRHAGRDHASSSSLITFVGALALAASGKGNRKLWAMVGGLPLAVAIARRSHRRASPTRRRISPEHPPH